MKYFRFCCQHEFCWQHISNCCRWYCSCSARFCALEKIHAVQWKFHGFVDFIKGFKRSEQYFWELSFDFLFLKLLHRIEPHIFFLCAIAAAPAATCCRRLWRHRIGTLRMRRTICNLQLIERVRRRSLLSALTLLNPLLEYPRNPSPNPILQRHATPFPTAS